MNALPVNAEAASQALNAGGAPAPRKVAGTAEAHAAAQEFESFFISQMLGHMFEGVRVDGPFGGGYGEGVYRSFLLKAYGDVLTKAGGIGIADMVTRELLNTQEVK